MRTSQKIHNDEFVKKIDQNLHVGSQLWSNFREPKKPCAA